MDWYLIITTIVIPFIVMGLRKLNIVNSKWAPTVAFAAALVLVIAGKFLGVELDVNTIAQAITTALASAGVAVLGYDQVKKLTEPTK